MTLLVQRVKDKVTRNIPVEYRWLFLAGMLYLLAVVVDISMHPAQFQWDFKTYYYAAKAYRAGLDPYYLRSLSQVAGRTIGFPFAYPPATLILLQPLLKLDYSTAYTFYLGLKILAFATLFYLWNRRLLALPLSGMLLVFTLVGFGGAALVDLTAGNISIFEQLFLWGGFLAILRQKSGLAGIALLFASLFKLLPILFLPLLFLSEDKHRVRNFLLTGAAFVLVFGAMTLTMPGLTGSFLSVASKLDSRGIKNPAILALLRDIAEALTSHGVRVPDHTPTVLYALLALAILGLSWRAFRRHSKANRLEIITFACLVFALCIPRMKDYSYLLVVLPAYVFVFREGYAVNAGWILLLFSLSQRYTVPFGFAPAAANLFWNYYPLFCLGLLWAMVVHRWWSNPTARQASRLPPGSPA